MLTNGPHPASTAQVLALQAWGSTASTQSGHLRLQPQPPLDRPLTPSSYTLKEFIDLGIERAHLDRPYRPLTPNNDNPNQSTTKVLTADDFRADYYQFYKGSFWIVGHGTPLGLHTNWNNAKAASQGYKGSPGATKRDDFDQALAFFLEIIYSGNVVLRRRTEQRNFTPSPSPFNAKPKATTSTPSSRSMTQEPSSRAATQEPSTPRAHGHLSSVVTPRHLQSPGHSADNPILLYTPTPPKLNLATKPKPSLITSASVTPAGVGSVALPSPGGICAPSSPSPAQGSSKALKRKYVEGNLPVASSSAGPSSSVRAEVVDDSNDDYRRLPGYPTALGAAISSLTGYEISRHSSSSRHSTPRAKKVAAKASPGISDPFEYNEDFFAELDLIEAQGYASATAKGDTSGKSVDRSFLDNLKAVISVGPGVDFHSPPVNQAQTPALQATIF